MRYHETHFEDYLVELERKNLHPKLEKIFKQFPENVQQFKNVIFFGPAGVGKYTQMLKSIKKYSPSELKYEKKLCISSNKDQHVLKMSDIHFEVDMSLLGCNPKILWHDIYLQIIEIVSAKVEKQGIIVCKFFHEIHNELLDIFYSYMQKNVETFVDLKFILITSELSFIPDNILNCCFVINVARPTKQNYIRCTNHKISNKMQVENITNIKLLHLNINNEDFMVNHKIICDKIISQIININEIRFLKFRDVLYDIFIYGLDISECIWYILSSLMRENVLQQTHLSPILIKTYGFFQYYNNNYRPIYHLENYLFHIIQIIHSLNLKLKNK
jgi:hypothetical protein